jgi:hypothetical protein
MGIAEALEELRTKLDALEAGPATVGDWHRLDARAARALIAAQHELAQVQREVRGPGEGVSSEPMWLGQHTRVCRVAQIIEELRMIRLCAEGRILELQAEAMERGFTDRIPL